MVSVRIDEDGHVEYAREIEGDSVADVLDYVEYDTKAILTRLRKTAENAVRDKKMNVKERRSVMKAFEDGLRGYTYFER